MLITSKVIMLFFDLYDGTKPLENLSDFQKKNCLKKKPTLFEFYGYIYFFPSFLVGPVFNMKEYLDFIDMSLFETVPNKKQPKSFIPSIKKFFIGLICGLITILLGNKYGLEHFRENKFYENYNFLQRLGYLWLGTFACRWPYYYAWIVAEASCILCGIGFQCYKNGKIYW
jgi:lysophospholipid acyltransferase